MSKSRAGSRPALFSCCYTRHLRLTLSPLPVALCAALAIGAWAGARSPQTATTSTTKKKKSVAKSTTKAATKTATTTAAKRSTTSKKRPPVTARRPQQPSPERYKEIQQALASKGYFHTEPDGNWGPASIEALKRFQHDQSLVEDGKIGSLSLIALGLGPKREPVTEPEQKTP
jgi:peptidoglycan hydrolase-like protein with peptidoglycan-binding domain